MPQWGWMSALVGGMTGVALVAASAAGAVETKAENDLFGFRQMIFEHAAEGIGLQAPLISCERPLDAYGYDTPEAFYFVGDGTEAGAQLWVLAGFAFTDLAQLWVGQPFSYDITVPPSAEWGWIYDRNGDGRIDWMSYVESTVYLVPEEGLPEALSLAMTDEAAAVSPDLDSAFSGAVRTTFIHTIDADFDGAPDHFIAVPTEEHSGWGDGAMMITLAGDGGGVSDCSWRSDYRRADDRACVARDGGFATVGPGPVRERSFPVEGLIDYFELLSGMVADCAYPPGGVAARP